MILQGIDIVAVSKMKRIMLARPEFAEEIFSNSEREYCFSRPDPYVHLAGRFAAKEACSKALGTGLSGSGIDGALREIEVTPERSGRPCSQSMDGLKKSDAEGKFTSTLYRFHIQGILPLPP